MSSEFDPMPTTAIDIMSRPYAAARVTVDHAVGESRNRLLALAVIQACKNGQDMSGKFLRNADFRGLSLEGLNLSSCDLTGADFNNAKLSKVKLNDAVLIGATMRGANLSATVLERATCTGMSLYGTFVTACDLRHATFVDANLSRTTMVETDLSGVNVEKADLEGAIFKRSRMVEMFWREVTQTSGLDLYACDLSRSDFVKCLFDQMTMRAGPAAWIGNGHMKGVTMRDTLVLGGRIEGIIANGLKAQGVRLKGTEISHLDLNDADLGDFTLEKVEADVLHMGGAGRREVTVKGGSIKGLGLAMASPSLRICDGATVSKANFRLSRGGSIEVEDATLEHASFAGVKLDSTRFADATIKDTEFAGGDLGAFEEDSVAYENSDIEAAERTVAAGMRP